MKCYLAELLGLINQRIIPNETNLLRLEGVEDPAIYLAIHNTLKHQFGSQLVTYIAPEKVKAFESVESYRVAIAKMEEEHIIDKNRTMTSIRNQAGDETPGVFRLYLLMGTEVAQDTGGLGDFGCVSTSMLSEIVAKDYSRWFTGYFEMRHFDPAYLVCIKQIYRSVFRFLPLNTLQLSNLIDRITDEIQPENEKELINYITRTLNTEWGIPCIDNERIIKPDGKAISRLVESAACFISRNESFLKRINSKITEKITKYTEKIGVSMEDGIPAEKPIFPNYYVLKDALIDFADGQRIDELKPLFLDCDFSIIADILGIKGPGPGPRNSVVTVHGDPIRAYSEIVFHAVKNYLKEMHEYPSLLRINVTKIVLSECNDESLGSAYSELIITLGGIVDYLNGTVGFEHDGNHLEIQYLDKIDPFTLKAYQDSFFARTSTTRNWEDMCRVEFSVSLDNNSDVLKYKWIFSPKAPWKKALSFYKQFEDDETTSLLLLKSDNLENCFTCEDADEFCTLLEESNPVSLGEEIKYQVQHHFSTSMTRQLFDQMLVLYDSFVEKICEYGIFASLESMTSFVDSYNDLIRVTTERIDDFTSSVRDKLYLIADLFLVVDAQDIINNASINGAIVPAYHPLSLEKIKAQFAFLRNGLMEKYAEEFADGNLQSWFDSLWTMSKVGGSLDAVVSSSHRLLSLKQMHGFHAVYLPNERETSQLNTASSLGIIYDDEEDVDVKSSLENSKIILHNIFDYIKTYPASGDCIKIAIINPVEMQHIVATMYRLDEEFAQLQRKLTVKINILCVDAQKNAGGYLKHWLDSYFTDEGHSIEIQTNLRYLFSSNGQIDGLEKILDGSDICFVYDVMEEKNIIFKPTPILSGIEGKDIVQFPMVSLPEPLSMETGQQRSISSSQFQFESSKLYTQLIHVITYPHDEKGKEYRAAYSLEISALSKFVLDVAQKQSRWLVCIDKAIDRDLMSYESNKIIGFSTGEGDYGDTNVTVSAEASILEDIHHMLVTRLFERFTEWDKQSIEKAADYCIQLSSNLDGVRILQALNPNDYAIHSYLAYILVLQELKMTEVDDGYIQRVLINLDAYQHWFNKDNIGSVVETNSRPDLLLLEIEKNVENLDPNKPLNIKATIIECKMGDESAAKLNDAERQVCNGFEVMSSRWHPDSSSIARRYWFNQLFRSLIFTKINIPDNLKEYQDVSEKIRRILYGDFTIDWHRAIYAFWVNTNSDSLNNYTVYEDGYDIDVHVGGQIYIKKMLLPEAERSQVLTFEVIKKEDENEEATNEDIPETGVSVPVIVNIDSSAKADGQTSTSSESGIEVQNQEAGEKKGEEKEEEKEKPEEEKQGEASSEENTESNTHKLEDVRIRLGEDINHNTYYWEYGNPGLNNRHLLINGNSGCGKTYAIQALLMEEARQGVSAVVFDYTAGFTPSKLDPVFKSELGDRLRQCFVRSDGIAVNPFKKHDIKLDEDLYIPESDTDVASKIANILTKVYSFGEQQKSAIYISVMEGLEKYKEDMTFVKMAELLENQGTTYAKTVINKIRPFIDMNPFIIDQELDWGSIRDSEGQIMVIQLTGYSPDIRILLTEILLWDIWSFCEKNGDETKPFITVLDEAQNLDHSEFSPSAKILTEGRKFGLSGWYATQFMKPQLSDAEIQRLQQAGQTLYFCPPPEGVMTVAKNIDITSNGSKMWAERLMKLKKGECVTCGGMVKDGRWAKYIPRIIKITSLQERVEK